MDILLSGPCLVLIALSWDCLPGSLKFSGTLRIWDLGIYGCKALPHSRVQSSICKISIFQLSIHNIEAPVFTAWERIAGQSLRNGGPEDRNPVLHL